MFILLHAKRTAVSENLIVAGFEPLHVCAQGSSGTVLLHFFNFIL